MIKAFICVVEMSKQYTAYSEMKDELFSCIIDMKYNRNEGDTCEYYTSHSNCGGWLFCNHSTDL